jgi:polyhydroxyalkanoic acid synthase PhaR subunit
MTKTNETAQDTDVFGVWRQLYDANEKAWGAALEQAMETPEFGESSGKLLETMVAAQKSVRDNMRAYLETMNVPTREDIARLGELVVGIEEKIDQVADRLDALDASLRSRSAEPGKIDRIADRIDTIDRSLRTRAAEAAKIDRIAKRLDTIDRSLRSRAAEAAKIDRIAKRLDTIDRSLRSRAAEAAKPAARAARAAATKSATTAVTASKPARAVAKPARAVAKPARAAAKPTTKPTRLARPAELAAAAKPATPAKGVAE